MQDVLLDRRCQQQQVHDLRQTGACEAVVSGHVGVVAGLAAFDPGFDVVGQGEETGDTGRVWGEEALFALGPARRVFQVPRLGCARLCSTAG